MAVSAPEIAAKRKLKKHERVREKRKHEKILMVIINQRKRE